MGLKTEDSMREGQDCPIPKGPQNPALLALYNSLWEEEQNIFQFFQDLKSGVSNHGLSQVK